MPCSPTPPPPPPPVHTIPGVAPPRLKYVALYGREEEGFFKVRAWVVWGGRDGCVEGLAVRE